MELLLWRVVLLYACDNIITDTLQRLLFLLSLLLLLLEKLLLLHSHELGTFPQANFQF